MLFEVPIASSSSQFSIDARWSPLGPVSLTIVRLILPDGGVRAYELVGDVGRVQLDPAWYQATARFVALGFEHILGGFDHLLFLFALVIPFRRFRELVVVVTAFTLAHSITLIASAYDLAPAAPWFPPLIEMLIAASIVYMTFENIIGAQLHRRWLITFAFGLVHGFGFSFALKQTLQFAGAHLLASLLAFNIGVELGQLLVLALVIPALGVIFRYVDEKVGVVCLSAFVAHQGAHWFVERAGVLRHSYLMVMPDLTTAFFAALFRWVLGIAVFVAAMWAMSTVGRSRLARPKA